MDPLCHPLVFDSVAVDLVPRPEISAVEITTEVKGTGKTGYEMEALVAASAAALALYDMCKAADKGIEIREIALLEKTAARAERGAGGRPAELDSFSGGGMGQALIDGHGRRITYVRISVTDRCNLRCVYCMPEDQKFRPLPHLLSREEIRRAARLLASSASRRSASRAESRRRAPISRTSCATSPRSAFRAESRSRRTASSSRGWRTTSSRPGLTKVNVSLDAAEAEHFRKMTRRDHFKPVVDSIALALSLPFESVKINAVVIRGLNDDQILPLAAMTKDKKLGVRFIEFMPVRRQRLEGDGLGGLGRGVGPARRRRLRPVADRQDARGRARRRVLRHVAADAHRARSASSRRSRTGSATPATGCGSTQDGFLKGCLFGHADVDLLKPMRAGASDEELRALVRARGRDQGGAPPMFVGMSKSALPCTPAT